MKTLKGLTREDWEERNVTENFPQQARSWRPQPSLVFETLTQDKMKELCLAQR